MKSYVSVFLIASVSAAWQQGSDISKASESCSIEDYATDQASWVTNCPSSCAILDYIEVAGNNINKQWTEIEEKIKGKLGRSGLDGDLHMTLQQIIIRLKEILASMMSEKEKFDEIEKIYHSGDIPTILANQAIKVNELSIKRTQLQQTVIGLKKNFIEQTGFCKVSFKEYNEQVCDIISHAKGIN